MILRYDVAFSRFRKRFKYAEAVLRVLPGDVELAFRSVRRLLTKRRPLLDQMARCDVTAWVDLDFQDAQVVSSEGFVEASSGLGTKDEVC